MKTNAIVRIILFSITIIILLGLLAGGLLLGVYTYDVETLVDGISNNIDTAIIDDSAISDAVTFDPDQIKDIEIDWAAGSITIQPSNTDTIQIMESEVSDSKDAMVYKQSGSKLTIEYCKSASAWGGINFGSDPSKHLVITVPEGWSCNSLEIDAAAAGVEVSNLTIKEVDLDGASGRCEFTNCTVDEIDLDTASGDFHFSGSLEILDCDAASANCKINVTNIPKRITLDSASGSLDLTLPENCGFSCSLSSLSGHFSSDFATTSNGDNYLYGDGSCRIDVSAMSGDVTIRKGS